MIPNQCIDCPAANFLKQAYDEAVLQESVILSLEVEARLTDELEVAELASNALAKIWQKRKLAEIGLDGIKNCAGYSGQCARGYTIKDIENN